MTLGILLASQLAPATRGVKEEVFLIIIGALIGVGASVLTLLATYKLDEYGKIKIYTKVVYDKAGGKTWGFLSSSIGEYFQVPVWLEIHNTSKVTKVVRDFNLLLFYKGKEICSMTQMNEVNDTMYANKGSYSFVIEPHNIQKYDCHFMVKKNSMIDNYDFDEIRISYFDTRDKQHIAPFKSIINSWNGATREKDNHWTLIAK